MRAEDFTPDVDWGHPAARVRDRRRPRTRFFRGIRRLLGQWWVWTTYIGVILGVAVYGLFAPTASADDTVWTFSAPAVEYVTEHGVEICMTLDTATVDQVGELMHKLETLGDLTEQQAGEALYFSALGICPIHMGLLDAYAERSLVLA